MTVSAAGKKKRFENCRRWGSFPEAIRKPRGNSGFTLIELLTSLFVGIIVLGAMYSLFIIQNKHFTTQEQIAEMQQIARTTMDAMAREITMAGFDPNKSLSTPAPANAAITAAGATSLSFTADLNANSALTDANENVTYAFNSANFRITRDTGGGAQPFAENIEDLAFTYYDGSGAVTATIASIRRIRIAIRARTAKPDPGYTSNGGYRTYTLTSYVTPRNLNLPL
jgi:type IV pilus assembly protein PilW